MDGHGVQSGNRDHFEDPHKPSPSPVVHVRGLTENVLEADLVDAVQQYGPISFVLMMPKKRMALVEFETLHGAMNCVEQTQNHPVHVSGAPAYFNYSTSQKIMRPSGEEKPNKILLFTVLNPQYPITVDVMHTICSASGQVQRIVIFKKNGVQAMVEFDSIESARQAKQALNGADIYSGCCTLKIDYAKPHRLNVFKNDNESWDFTNPSLAVKEPHAGKNAPLLADPRYGAGPTPYGAQGEQRRGPPSPAATGYAAMDYSDSYETNGRPDRGGYGAYGGYYDRPARDPYGQQLDRYGRPMQQGYGAEPPPQAGMLQQGSVLMVYGLNMENINANKLFNLFCLYGNVVKVKFLKSKEGSAMIQMGDNPSCERAVKNLNGIFFFGSKMQLGYSKQAYLQDVPNPHELPDGTMSFVDFMGNRNNRFTTIEAAQKNRIQPPSKVLHYFNAPPGITEEGLRQVFTDTGSKPPDKVKQFVSKTPSQYDSQNPSNKTTRNPPAERSSTGLLEWESKGDALEALINANHSQIPNPSGKNPYVFKLCFSSKPIM